MANALVVHKDRLPQSQKTLRAAQCVRMSTDFQQYSIENQTVVIAAYAQLHNLSIVRTYRDEGESGLTIKNRMGLCVTPVTWVSAHREDVPGRKARSRTPKR
jgi:Resolvase, N terminal domain